MAKWNDSLLTSPRYAPLMNIDLGIRVSFSVTYTMISIYAVVANVLILYLKSKQRAQKESPTKRAFSRDLMSTFIRSLAWSDFLCGVTAVPVYVISFFIDVLRYEWVCKIVRYLSIVFPTVTMLNLLVIGVERYAGIFHPFSLPSNRCVQVLVATAWLFGSLISLVPTSLFTATKHYVSNDSYSLVCDLTTTTEAQKAMLLTTNTVAFFIPSLVLFITSVRVLRFLQKRSKNPKNLGAHVWRFKSARMFAQLILTFIIPYSFFFVYSGLKRIVTPDHVTDYILSYLSVLLVFLNSAVSPTMVFFSVPDLRVALGELVDHYVIHRRNNFQGVHADIVSQKRGLASGELDHNAANVQRVKDAYTVQHGLAIVAIDIHEHVVGVSNSSNIHMSQGIRNKTQVDTSDAGVIHSAGQEPIQGIDSTAH